MAARAAALVVALLAMVVAHGVRALQDPELNHTSSGSGAARQLQGSGGWQRAKATWYGAPNGAGPDDNGGACGFKGTNQYPFMSMTSCGNQPLFNDGQGCGSCYQIMCTDKNNRACSGQPKTVMITDMNYYPVAQYHFDLSGTAFGAMAMPGRNDELRHAGIIDMWFRRVPCYNRGLTIDFRVQRGSNPVYLALLVQYANKEGTVSQMDLLEYGSRNWTPMRRSWGSVWRLDSNHPLRAPFSIRVRGESWRSVTAYNVIPANWRPDTSYRSNVQY